VSSSGVKGVAPSYATIQEKHNKIKISNLAFRKVLAAALVSIVQVPVCVGMVTIFVYTNTTPRLILVTSLKIPYRFNCSIKTNYLSSAIALCFGANYFPMLARSISVSIII
jgi:hypothetical protein